MFIIKNNIKVFLFLTIITFVFVLFLTRIEAHGTEQSFEIKEGKYLVDIGYDASIIEAHTPIDFNFNVLTQENANPQTFNNIWIRVEEGGDRKRTIFATGVSKPSFGLPTMIFTFPTEGAYTLYARFEDSGGTKIVEVETPIFVQKPTNDETTKAPWLLFVLVGCVGLMGGLYIPKLFKKYKA